MLLNLEQVLLEEEIINRDYKNLPGIMVIPM